MSKKEKIIPRGVYILIRPEKSDGHETEQGLSVPDQVEEERKAKGEVIATGSKVDSDVAVGDIVIYGVFSGDEIKKKGSETEVEFVLVKDEDVLAIVK